MSDGKPKGALEKFYHTIEEYGGLSIVLPLTIIIGFGLVKIIQHLSGE